MRSPLSTLFLFASATLAALVALPAPLLVAQVADPKAFVNQAVQSELASNRADHTAFVYKDRDVTPDHDTLFQVIETPKGSLKRKLEDHGKPLTLEQRQADDAAVAALLGNSQQQAKNQRDSSHDDAQAEAMLKLLPVAFLWTVASEQGELVTLNFKPDPKFDPNGMEARVLSAMAGQITVSKPQMRIRSIKGTLVNDVTLGFGVLARMHKGGSFQVERREVVPRHWQVTESKVHILGHALFFKTVGSEEDEFRSEFHVSNAQNLKQATEMMTTLK